MPIVFYADTENVTKRWLLTTGVAPLVMRGPGQYSIYLAMPPGAPLPAIRMVLVSGGPDARKDIPQQTDRLQFDCWAGSRDSAGLICRTLISEMESLARGGGFHDTASNAYLVSAQVVTKRWLPDPDSDTPRYIVDALITTVI